MTIDRKYRESAEYKQNVAEIQSDYPQLPIYFIEMYLSVLKDDPKFIKTLHRMERSKQYNKKINEEFENIDKDPIRLNHVIEDAVRIYNDASELPEIPLVKTRVRIHDN